MPIHNCLRCSNTLYMYAIDVGCSLKGSTASFTCKKTFVMLKNAEKLVVITKYFLLTINVTLR